MQTEIKCKKQISLSFQKFWSIAKLFEYSITFQQTSNQLSKHKVPCNPRSVSQVICAIQVTTNIQQSPAKKNERSDEWQQEAAQDLSVNKSSSRLFTSYLHKLLDNFSNPLFLNCSFLTNLTSFNVKTEEK